ncbi:MAG TPA: hypothetical protein VFQ88_00625 [Nevskiaceae bacterium]|nr:hypothetical protein [Nevskiaceae bacterium]
MSTAVLASLALMVALGVRHGCDPEHVAIVNSVTLRAAERGRRWPAASGLYFALGHGLVITLVALGLVGILHSVRLPAWSLVVASWLPAAILLLVAVVNLRELLRDRADYRPVSVKQRLLPRWLGDSSSPAAVFVIGVLFAPFVDPATQAAVWGYAVTVTAGPLWVLALGALLTTSMAITCVLEARGVLYLMSGAPTARHAARRRRAVGWLIVAFAFAVVGWTIATALHPAGAAWWLRLAEALVIGAALAGVTAAALRWHPRRWARSTGSV